MKKFDQHIKEKLSQPQLPPVDAWKNIEEKLDEKEKKKRLLPIFYWIGSTAACLVAGIGIYYFNQNESIDINNIPSNEIVKSKTTPSENPLPSIKNSEEQNSVENVNKPVHQQINHSKKLGNNSFQYLNHRIEQAHLFSTNKENEQKESLTPGLALNNSIQHELSIQTKNSALQNNETEKKEFSTNAKDEKPLELVLEEEKKKQDEKIEIKKMSPILAVSSYINPTMMLESKSILANEFNDHTIKNNMTVAYGAKVSVRLNDKLNIRSGIAKVELEQQTNNINSGINTGVYAISSNNINLNSSTNITYNSNIRVIANTAGHQNPATTMLTSQSSNMEQKIHYIEVPLEMEYRLASFDKFNLLATAGGSYYVVTKNSISLTDANSRSQYTLGKANNLNTMSYSANAGVKLEYILSNKSSLNLEPNYRYMLNPLQNVDAKNPSLLGLNIGFSIKF